MKGVSSTIPRRFHGLAIDRHSLTVTDRGRPMDFPATISRDVIRFCDTIEQKLSVGNGLWFEGDPGTGKTSLAMLVAKSAIDAGKSVAIYSVPRLLTDIRHTFDSASDDSYRSLLRRLVAVDLLQLDDLGAEKQTEWVLEQLYSIVNERYEDGKSVVLTTNLDQQKLSEQIGSRTVSRLAQMCQVFPLWGTDRRLELDIGPTGEEIDAGSIEVRGL